MSAICLSSHHPGPSYLKMKSNPGLYKTRSLRSYAQTWNFHLSSHWLDEIWLHWNLSLMTISLSGKIRFGTKGLNSITMATWYPQFRASKSTLLVITWLKLKQISALWLDQMCRTSLISHKNPVSILLISLIVCILDGTLQ